jgi:hypothetical protein
MKEITPKPCPVCHTTESMLYNEDPSGWYVLCVGPKHLIEKGPYRTKGEAIIAWNKKKEKSCMKIPIQYLPNAY